MAATKTGEHRAALEAFSRALSLESHNLVERPDLLWQQLYNRLRWSGAERPLKLVDDTLQRHRTERNAKATRPWFRLLSGSLESPALMRTCQTGAGWVLSCAICPDSTLVASGGGDGFIRVWDAAGGRQLVAHDSDGAWAMDCSFNPDGTSILSAHADGLLRLWTTEGGLQRTFRGHDGPVLCGRFSPDGSSVISGGADKTVRLWAVYSGEPIRTLRNHTEPVTSCAISPDGRLALSGSADRGVQLWDLANGQPERRLTGHTREVSCCVFDPQGTRIASASWDGTVIVWDTATASRSAVLRGHLDQVTCCAWSPDGDLIVSGSVDGSVRLWDPRTGVALATMRGHSGPVNCCAVSADGSMIASGAADNSLKLWKTPREASAEEPEGHVGPLLCSSFSPDGRSVASGGWDNTVRVWQADTGRQTGRYEGHTGWVVATAFSADGRLIRSASTDGTTSVIEAVSGRESERLDLHAQWIESCDFSSDDKLIAVGVGGRVAVWDAERKERVSETALAPRAAQEMEHEGAVRAEPAIACRFSRDGTALAGAATGPAVVLQRSDRWRRPQRIGSKDVSPARPGFSPDNARLVLASSDDRAVAWDRATKTRGAIYEPDVGALHSCEFDPDGRWCLLAGHSRYLRLIDAESGSEVACLAARGDLECASFDASGRRVCCGDSGGNLYVLELEGLPPGDEAVRPDPAPAGDTRVDPPEQWVTCDASSRAGKFSVRRSQVRREWFLGAQWLLAIAVVLLAAYAGIRATPWLWLSVPVVLFVLLYLAGRFVMVKRKHWFLSTERLVVSTAAALVGLTLLAFLDAWWMLLAIPLLALSVRWSSMYLTAKWCRCPYCGFRTHLFGPGGAYESVVDKSRYLCTACRRVFVLSR